MHSPPALRALDLQICSHTTLLPHKKPVSTCVNTGLTCMLCGAPSLHALTCMLCGARSSEPRALAPRTRALAARTRGSHLRGRYLRLHETLDAVLGDACKEQRF